MPSNRQAYYASLAKSYKSASLLKKCKAAVCLEDKRDKDFWEKILRYVYPNDTFDFVSFTRTPSGDEATGCEQCLMYVPYLDSRLAIAIDSDMRYLTQEPVLNNQYVLHTYTYSFENHLCYAHRIENILTTLSNGAVEFDIQRFLLEYSSAIYSLILYCLEGNTTIEALNKATSLPFSSDTSLISNGDSIIQMLENRVQNIIGKYTPSKEVKDHFQTLGLTEDVAYLYVRGHNLYNLVYKIGKSICNIVFQQERDALIATCQQNDIPMLHDVLFGQYEGLLQSSDLMYSYDQMEQCIDKVREAWP